MSFDLKVGHCLELLEELEPDSVDVCITSPPWWSSDYDVPLVEGWGRLGCEDDPQAYVDHVVDILVRVHEKLTGNGIIWLAVQDRPDDLGRLLGLPGRIGTSPRHRLSWVYTCYYIPDGAWVPKGAVPHGPMDVCVPILGFCQQPRGHYWKSDTAVPNWLVYPLPAPAKGLPFWPLCSNVVGDLIEWTCPSGGTVLDPMCGSGTVPAVANVMGCHGVGFDLSEKSIQVARRKVRSMRRMAEDFRKAQRERFEGGAIPRVDKERLN